MSIGAGVWTGKLWGFLGIQGFKKATGKEGKFSKFVTTAQAEICTDHSAAFSDEGVGAQPEGTVGYHEDAYQF